MEYIGASSFEPLGWKYTFNSIEDAGKHYKKIWGNCWIEDQNGNIIQKF